MNSQNCSECSKGTRAFIVECHRLTDRCLKHAESSGDPSEVCEAFELIFALLRYIDECRDDVLFFADEGGSWQVGIRWEKVVPVWLSCLARVADPGDYARRVMIVMDGVEDYARTGQLDRAMRCGSAAQRDALAALLAQPRRG